MRWFAAGNTVTLSDELPFAEYEGELRKVPGLLELAADHGETREARALAAELILDGLHQHLKLGRHDLDSRVSYKEMLKFQLLRPPRPARGRGEVN